MQCGQPQLTGLPLLADKAQIGDYVNYPVYYDNVNGSTLKGWRVISKNIDLDGNPSPGTVNLVSAGVPLTYYHTYGNSSTSVENLTTKFLEIPFTADQGCTYRKTGFLPYIALTEIFNTKYTKVSGEKLQVRAMKAEDIYGVTGLTEMQIGTTMNLSAVKYNKLLVNGANYWLASAFSSNYVWFVGSYGNVSYTNSIENRCPPCSFSKL